MLELTLKRPIEERIDGSPLSPQRLLSLPLADLMSLPLTTSTSRTVPLDSLFWVQWPTGPSDMMVIRGNCSLFDDLGHGMSGGTLVIDGHAGHRLGARISGGRLIVAGNVSDEACMGMKGGMVAIAGNCGDCLGAPVPGERSGIRGGDIMIAGNVGCRACHRMRRGTVWIAGNVGEYLAAQLIAGTLLVNGKIASQWGMGMRRGSLVCLISPESESGASLSPGRKLELSFLPLVWNHLLALQRFVEETCEPLDRKIWTSSPLPTTRWVERRIADLAVGGKGEVLILQRLSSMLPSRGSFSSEGFSPES